MEIKTTDDIIQLIDNNFPLEMRWVAVDDVMQFIDNQRDNGNLQPDKGFSPAVCLSSLIKKLEERG